MDPAAGLPVGTGRGERLLGRVLAGNDPSPSGEADGPLRHVVHLPPRPGRPVDWPDWVPGTVRAAFVERGVRQPWSHQARAAELAHTGRDVVVATGTASGKSLAYQLPVLSAFAADRRATALYLSPTKALAADQLRALAALGLAGRAGRPLRRRHPARRARLGPPARPVAVQQPGHAAPLAASAARPLGRLPAAPALRGARRVPHLPRLVRLARGAAAAPAAAGLRALRCPADDRAGVGDRGGAGRLRGAADGPRGRGRGRRRFARGRPDRRAVGTAAARRADRGERCAGAPLRRCGVGPDAGRPRRRGRPHAGVRPLAAGCGADGARRPAGARRGGPRAGAAGVGVPRRLPAGGAAGARGRAGRR